MKTNEQTKEQRRNDGLSALKNLARHYWTAAVQARAAGQELLAQEYELTASRYEKHREHLLLTEPVIVARRLGSNY